VIEHINPPELGTPSGYSHAVAVSADKLVFLAGQTALNAEGRIVGTTVVEQFEQALGNLLTALRAAGGQPADLVSLTVYIVDMEDYKAHARQIGAVWRRLIGTAYPAMAGIGVSRLWDVEAVVEVQGHAAITTNRSTRTASSAE
jgi:enamine deaminase RidA (YjgF/YER057c/UK114 family)